MWTENMKLQYMKHENYYVHIFKKIGTVTEIVFL